MSALAIQDGQAVLMIGDSITDAGRRADAAPYGRGYVAIFREMLTALYPERDITVINKGIGGNTTTDLRERWEDDCIRHQPDWLTILIGINDLHRTLRETPEAVPPDVFRANYDWILQRATDETDAQIVLLDPFYMSVASEDTFRSRVLELIEQYIEIVHDMAEKYDAQLVRMHDVFREHLKYRESEEFCAEPVHPARGGHIVIAVEMLKTLGGI